MGFKLNTDQEIMVTLGYRLKRIRLRKNILQKHLAKKAGISLRAIQKIENGVFVNLKTLVAIARALGRIDDFLFLFKTPTISPMEYHKMKNERIRSRKKKT